jgi:NADH-quinone oxidoreductase subunit J
MELVVFVLAAAMVLVGALGVVVIYRNPVHAALSLVLTLFGIAVMFVSQEAHFLAAVQVIVYAGAIVVLFLFVIMLLGVDRAEDLRIDPLKVQRPLAIVIGGGLIGLLVAAIVAGRRAVPSTVADTPPTRGRGIAVATIDGHDANIEQLSRSLFGDYVLAFELTSVLLVVAVAGTVLMTRKVRKVSDA